jgi:hypothetical protein
MSMLKVALILSVVLEAAFDGIAHVRLWSRGPLLDAWNSCKRRLSRTGAPARRLAIGPGPATAALPVPSAASAKLLLFRVAAEAAALARERATLDERWINLATVETAVTNREIAAGHYEASLGVWATQLTARNENQQRWEAELADREAELADRETRFAEAQTPKPIAFDEDLRPLLYEAIISERQVSEPPAWNSPTGWHRLYHPAQATAEAADVVPAGV